MARCDCDPNLFAAKFDEPYATEKLELYRSQGPDPSTRALLDAILAEGVTGRTLLDIGGGVGAIQHELLDSGVRHAQEVEASRAYIAACQQEAQRRGHADRVEHVFGEFGAVADRIDEADIVTLDRSPCCWGKPLELIGGAAAKSRWLLGMVFPRDSWWVRYGWRPYGNVKQILKRSQLRLHTPRHGEVEQVVRDRGFTRRSLTEMGVWSIVVWEKEPA